VLAIGDVEASLCKAETVRRHFPHVKLFGRAGNRFHAYRLMDLGAGLIERETFLGFLKLAKNVLKPLGIQAWEAAQTIGRFLTENVEVGTMIKTDGWRGYSQTALSAYRHEAASGQAARHIHRAFGNLKTWLLGTHHGVDPKYLAHYLDEYVFRFNRRSTPMAAFQTLLGLTGARPPLGYRKLIEPVSKG